MNSRVVIRRLPSGVGGLDDVLGGGLPEFSFNLIAGGPGCGKTTIAHQIVFANASPQRPAIYFTILGEPPLKMLRYQQQFAFFDPTKMGTDVRFIHLGEAMSEGGPQRVLEAIVREVDALQPGIVVVDSFRSAIPSTAHTNIEHFVQELGVQLTARQATSFLVGEYLEQESHSNPLFTVADGIIWMYQNVIRNSVVRRLQVLKMRGQQEIPGLHTLKISDEGVRVFPRLPNPAELPEPSDAPSPIQKMGIPALDDMLGGGIPSGYSMLIVGPPGSGKSTLAQQFIVEGAANGERGVIAVFEKQPEQYLRSCTQGRTLARLRKEGLVDLVQTRSLDLSVDEAMEIIRQRIVSTGAKRVVLDSLSGFEMALAPTFRDDFRESLYRMVGGLTTLGVTVIMTVEIAQSSIELRLSPHGISFLTDGIVLQRYVEKDGQLLKTMAVVKMRSRPHSTVFREYEIAEGGLVVGRSMGAADRGGG